MKKTGTIDLEREQKLQCELARWVKVLKEKYYPSKIILFGSLANHSVSSWSDIDLIIIKKTDKSFLDRTKEVIEYINPKVGTDILVYTPEEFEVLSVELGFLKDEVKKKELYCMKDNK